MTVAVLGEALIDLIVGDDGAYRPHLGGSPFNVAIGLARQGIDVSYLSPFSDDTFGDQLHDALQREGVATPIERRSLWPTSLALVTIDDDGLPAYRLYREGIADKDTSFEEIRAKLPDELSVLHTGSLAITPSQLPKIRRLFKLMRDSGVTISMDINIRLRASLDTRAYLDGVRSLLPLADIVKASDEDLEPFELAASPHEAAARAYEEMGQGMLVLTEGTGGALLYTGEKRDRKMRIPGCENRRYRRCRRHVPFRVSSIVVPFRCDKRTLSGCRLRHSGRRGRFRMCRSCDQCVAGGLFPTDSGRGREVRTVGQALINSRTPSTDSGHSKQATGRPLLADSRPFPFP